MTVIKIFKNEKTLLWTFIMINKHNEQFFNDLYKMNDYVK